MSISQLAKDLKQSATLVMAEKARTLREQGEPVISMAAGEPFRITPAEAIKAGCEALATGRIHYTPGRGVRELIDAIIGYTQRYYDREIDAANVIATAGAKQGLFNLLISLVNPNEEVILLSPYWVSYPEIVKLVHGRPVIVNPPEQTFVPRLEDIERAISTATRAIVVNSPNNPSGAVYPPDLIGALVELCERKKIYLIMDDIYHRLVFNGVKAVSCFDYAKDLSDESPLIVINGVSKAYGMTGFRIGWVVANKNIIDALAKVSGQNTTCLSGPLQLAAAAALNGPQDCVEGLRKDLLSNRDTMMTLLDGFNGIKCVPPDGTFYCLPDFRAYEKDDVKLANFLLEKALVVTVPGCEFGAPGHLRLTYCGTPDDITDAVARIKWALDPESGDVISIGGRMVKRSWC